MTTHQFPTGMVPPATRARVGAAGMASEEAAAYAPPWPSLPVVRTSQEQVLASAIGPSEVQRAHAQIAARSNLDEAENVRLVWGSSERRCATALPTNP